MKIMITNAFNHSPEYQAYLKTLSSEFFLDILENSFIEVTVTDKDGKVLYANPACLEYHGISAEKMWKLNFLTSFQGFWTPPSTATAIKKNTPLSPASGLCLPMRNTSPSPLHFIIPITSW
ncbi:PAS domain S-box protein [Acetobacterium wieringae]|uniref:PAS domain S-box protein n=1 Tax=Acetobacterium wieringae TaxID=52694 RepID=UPI0020349F20|nr:PAS domain S-box protein [Acetobacterium wieringae]URN83846.1 PAS domain S-box protein [Acetobacterium wieringae]